MGWSKLIFLGERSEAGSGANTTTNHNLNTFKNEIVLSLENFHIIHSIALFRNEAVAHRFNCFDDRLINQNILSTNPLNNIYKLYAVHQSDLNYDLK